MLYFRLASLPSDTWFLARPDPPECQLDAIDAFLGYAPGACDTPPWLTLRSGLGFYFDRGGDTDGDTDPAAATGARAPVVLVLGGSTTDPVTMSQRADVGFDGWPKRLADLCRKAHPGCRVVNGGRAAFTAAQELLVLVRDGLALEPDVVVSLNGINEYYVVKDPILGQYPFVTRNHRERFARLCRGVGRISNTHYSTRVLPNAMRLAERLRGMLRGADAKPSSRHEAPTGRVGDCLLELGLAHGPAEPARAWRHNAVSMNALVRAHGGRYFAVLQPTLGIGGYVPQAGRDADLLAGLAERQAGAVPYLETMRSAYRGLRAECAVLDFCTDATDLFVGDEDVYSDARHPNRHGNQIQAEAIWALVGPALRARPEPQTPL